MIFPKKILVTEKKSSGGNNYFLVFKSAQELGDDLNECKVAIYELKEVKKLSINKELK